MKIKVYEEVKRNELKRKIKTNNYIIALIVILIIILSITMIQIETLVRENINLLKENKYFRQEYELYRNFYETIKEERDEAYSKVQEMIEESAEGGTR